MQHPKFIISGLQWWWNHYIVLALSRCYWWWQQWVSILEVETAGTGLIMLKTFF